MVLHVARLLIARRSDSNDENVYGDGEYRSDNPDIQGGNLMFDLKKTGVLAAAIVVAMAVTARAQESVKIGLILPMTGGQASTGKQIDNAIKLYMSQKGDSVAGKKIEIILKDDAALPDNTKRPGAGAHRQR